MDHEEAHPVVLPAAGTTDAPALGSRDPRAKSVDVDFLVQEISSYLRVDPEQMRADIQSVWCGHRPLVSQTQEGKDTAGVVRSHTVLVDESSGLVTLLGGKWTTYRRMAEDCNFNSGRLEHELSSSFPKLSFAQKEHLIRSYGFLARDVLNTGEQEGLLDPLVPGFPYLKAEVVYACR
ncbi:hypothetical protein ACSSS7_003250 [Eimeria intestinalis]